MKKFDETYTRTTVKSVIYRFLSVIVATLLTLSFGGTVEQALKFGAASLILGLLLFYIYDRLWIHISWLRNSEGKDAKFRTLIKSIFYRFTAWLTVVIFARSMWAATDMIAILMATTQFIVNLMTYFVTERIWNEIAWGKIIEDKQVNTV
jgi:uncharacterized membrane protein